MYGRRELLRQYSAVIIKHPGESGPPPRVLQKKIIIKELIELEGMVLHSSCALVCHHLGAQKNI